MPAGECCNIVCPVLVTEGLKPCTSGSKVQVLTVAVNITETAAACWNKPDNFYTRLFNVSETLKLSIVVVVQSGQTNTGDKCNIQKNKNHSEK